MSLRINNNIAASIPTGQLVDTDQRLGVSLERLSSGTGSTRPKTCRRPLHRQQFRRRSEASDGAAEHGPGHKRCCRWPREVRTN